MEDGVGMHVDCLSVDGDGESVARIARRNLNFVDLKTADITGWPDK
jgi:peptide deformylase